MDTGETPGRTPFGRSVYDTPGPPGSSSDAGSGAPPLRYDPSLTLDAFCARYTSSDNASFAEILHRSNILRRKKHAWAFDATAKQNRKVIEETKERVKLVEMVKRMAEGEGGIGLIEGGAGRPGERKMVEGVVTREERLAIEQGLREAPKMITAQGEGSSTSPDAPEGPVAGPSGTSNLSSTEVTGPNPKKRKAPSSSAEVISTWPHRTRNAFMFGPDAETAPYEEMPPPPHPKDKKTPLLGEPKAINYGNTRMEGDRVEQRRTSSASSRRSTTGTLSPTRSRIAAAINGTPYPAQQTDSLTPRVNGFSFVSAMPTPNPALLAPDEMDALMTWGEVASTPVRTDDPDSSRDPDQLKNFVEGDGEGPFKIQQTPHREELAHGLARQATRSLRDRHGVGLGLGTKLRKSLGKGEWGRERREVGLTPRRDEMLSPAAKMLLRKTGADTASRGMRSAVGAQGSHAVGATPKGGSDEAKKEEEARMRLKMARWDPTPGTVSRA